MVRSNLAQRILSAVILGPIVLWAAWVGGVPLAVLVVIAALGSLYEWNRVIGANIGLRVIVSAMIVVAVPLWFAGVGTAAWAGITSILLVVVLVGAWGAVAYTGGGLWDAVGAAVIGLTVLSVVTLARMDGHPMIWILAIVWAADTGAYAVGRTLGGPKLAPRVSPNKTWSGAIGGLLAGMLAGAVSGTYLEMDLQLVELVLLSAVLAVVSIMGDLLQSAWKRAFDVKDSGAILPGHGGILDRIDGLIPVAILASFYLR